MTDKLISTNGLHTLLARLIFMVGDNAGNPCQRIQFKGGEWPDSETDNGGLCEIALASLLEDEIKSLPAASPTTESVFKPYWPKGVEQGVSYRFSCDDANSEERVAFLDLFIAVDGDVHVSMMDFNPGRPQKPDPHPTARCRTYEGGGNHQRTRQALLWLAQAIRLDSKDLRQELPPADGGEG
jgi:hypothetical protein